MGERREGGDDREQSRAYKLLASTFVWVRPLPSPFLPEGRRGVWLFPLVKDLPIIKRFKGNGQQPHGDVGQLPHHPRVQPFCSPGHVRIPSASGLPTWLFRLSCRSFARKLGTMGCLRTNVARESRRKRGTENLGLSAPLGMEP